MTRHSPLSMSAAGGKFSLALVPVSGEPVVPSIPRNGHNTLIMNKNDLEKFADKISNVSDSSRDRGLIPAATVVLLRDGEDGLETLMLRKTSRIAFSGMWVFPGGRIDSEDGAQTEDPEQRARIAASRETLEETALVVEPEAMHWFAHWTPPEIGNRRFETWFFVALAPMGDVRIDEGEITDNQWISPGQALDQHAQGEIELVPPTYVTLHYLAEHASAAAALAALRAGEPRHYATRLRQQGEDLVAMWAGDAGYDAGEPDTPGKRHRLTMGEDGFRFDDSGIS